MIKCAMVGFGYWGRNVARTLYEVENLQLVGLYEKETSRVLEAKKLYPALKLYTSYKELLDDKIECVFIITPPQTHFTLALAALKAGKHTFVEKPLSLQTLHAKELYDLAEQKNLMLFSDHIFLHSPAVKYLKSHLDDFGNIISITSRRINLGLFQTETDCIWDLAIHDLSIIDYLVGLQVKKLSVFSKKYPKHPNDALANISLELENGVVALIHVSWLSPVKVREMHIGGTLQSAIYDEGKKDKLTIYTSGVVVHDNFECNDLYDKMVQYKLGEVFSPKLEAKLALNKSIECFRDLIIQRFHNENLEFYRDHTLRVVKVLEDLDRAKTLL